MHEGRDNALVMTKQHLRGIVVGYQIGKIQELGHVGRGFEGSQIESKAGERIGLENL